MKREDLIKTLLEAVIKNSEAGIHNGVMDRHLSYVENQYDYLEVALKMLTKAEDNILYIKYRELGDLLCDSTDEDNVETAIYRMLDYLENLNKTKFDFSNDEINELVKLIEE